MSPWESLLLDVQRLCDRAGAHAQARIELSPRLLALRFRQADLGDLRQEFGTLCQRAINRRFHGIGYYLRRRYFTQGLHTNRGRSGGPQCGCQVASRDILRSQYRLEVVLRLGSSAARFENVREGG